MGNNSPIFVLSCTGVTSACLLYGQLYANEHLAKAVIYFYDNAWAASTTRTYKTGQRHWASFIASFPAIPHYPFPHTLPRQFELALAFFAAHLALQPTITRGSTVASYLAHVRTEWRKAGCTSKYLSSHFVATVTRGIHRALPAKPDSRCALLLLDCIPPPIFMKPPDPPAFLLKFATILGFFGMLRFNVWSKLTPAAIILVTGSGRQIPLSRLPLMVARSLCRTFIGFYFRFRGKSTPVGDPPQAAYFPRICDIAPSFAPFCPLLLLTQMFARGLLIHHNRPIFPLTFTPRTLCPYIMYLSGAGHLSVDIALIKTHSLRIGGHTYFTAMGMAPDLTDYLGRRKVPRCSLRYFRSSPSLTLTAIRRFFYGVPPPTFQTG